MSPWRQWQGLPSLCPISTASPCNQFEDRTPVLYSPTGGRFLNELQRPDYMHGSHHNGQQGDMPYFIPYLREYVENYVIHHHVVLHGGHVVRFIGITCCLFHKYGIKGKHPELGGASREITCWHQASESSAWCQQVISLLAPPDPGCFPLALSTLRLSCNFEGNQTCNIAP